MLRRLADPLAVLVLVVLVLVELDTAYPSSITYDEFATIASSVHATLHGDAWQLPTHPPLARVLVGSFVIGLGVKERTAASVPIITTGPDMTEWGYGEA